MSSSGCLLAYSAHLCLQGCYLGRFWPPEPPRDVRCSAALQLTASKHHRVAPCVFWRQALAHPWLVEQGVAPRHPLDNVVLRRLQRFAAMNKLKRAALLVMAQNLSPAELAGLQHLFSAIDADGSGSITAAELRAALEGLGEKIPEDDLQVHVVRTGATPCC